jgi:hypothetical protein
MDETSLKKKSKYGKGTRHEDCWLFGGVDRATSRWFGVLTYGDRTKATLSALIKKHIKEGSTIISDKFASYVSANCNKTIENNPSLKEMRYTHRWVNHSKNFVDPTTGAHTNTIEGAWEIRVKRYFKVMHSLYVILYYLLILLIFSSK